MLPTGTVTFLFTDIQGSTPLWEHEPEKMTVALRTHNAALQQAIEAHGGVVFKVVGDEFQAAFPTAPQALSAAVAGQRALRAATWNELGELKVRMGLHTGQASLDPGGDEYAVSHTKNRVARIMSAAHGGQILASQETATLVQRDLSDDVTLEDLGEHHLKGLDTPEHIYQVCANGLPQDFPPIVGTTSIPNNLPLQLNSFIGRENEIIDVSEYLRNNRLVTLVGPTGTGKTRLSLRVAEEILERFPDGVWFVELAELGNPEFVPGTIAATLGLPEISTRSLPDQLMNYLRQKQLLILLDNCEHLVAACASISETLLQSCPNLKILASSLEALQVMGEITYLVPSLSVPDPLRMPPVENLSSFSALQLFAERAAAVDPSFVITAENARAITQICHRLDGIPLAIELAAARVNALTIEQIETRLDNRFRLLTSSSRMALPRQQTLRASVDWSYSLLDEMERLLLTRLSVFQGGWTLELASEVCGFDGLDEFDVLDGLTQLLNKSQIQSISGVDGGRRYRQLETIRQYSREKLLDSGSSEIVRNRHLDAYLHLIETAEPHLRGQHQVEWLDRLDVELDNLRTALEWAFVEDVPKGLHLATAIFWFWNNRNHRVEGESWLNKLQARIGEIADADLALLAEAKARQAQLQMSIGRLGKDVMQTAGEALALVEQLGEKGKLIRAIALWVLAISKKNLGFYSIANELGHQCLEIAVALGDPFMIAESYEILIDSEPDPISVRHFAEKHLALRRELGDLDGQIIAYLYMAINEFWSGNLDQAKTLCNQCMEISRTVKNCWGLTEGHSILGTISQSTGDMDKAIEHFERALEFVQDTGELGRIIRQLNALGWAYSTKGEWSEAERYTQQAILMARSNHFALWEVISNINLAEVAFTFDRKDLARVHYYAAVDVDRSQEHIFLDGLIAYVSGKNAMLSDDINSAVKLLRKSLKDAAETGDRKIMKHSLQALTVCAVRSGQIERAIRLRGLIDSRDWLLWPMTMPYLAPYNLDEELESTREAFTKEEYLGIYSAGKAMTQEGMLEFALQVHDE